jgi:hypothetical protein
MTDKNTIDNLTSKQSDYAVFLPALSSFYSGYVGKQRFDPNSIPPSRVPAKFENGIEGMNWLNPKEAYFPYKWALYSAGHANIDVTKVDPKEDMVRNRDPGSFILGDSGGFQIGKGVWAGEWRSPTNPTVKNIMADCIARGYEMRPMMASGGKQLLDKDGKPKFSKVDLVKEYQGKMDAAQLKRSQVLSWMDAYMDRGMTLDVPAWLSRSPSGQKATGITSFDDAVEGTCINNDYFMNNRSGRCKFLNVLQGEDHTDADKWYDQVKHYCDPKHFEKPFEGWAMGGQNACDVHLILKRLVALRFDKLLEPGLHDWMHVLGTSKLEWATLLTDIQRAIRKYHNPQFTISFDCASPFLATANGQVYYDVRIEDRQKWSYLMQKSVDNKKYALDTRSFRDALLQDKIFDSFIESPISERTLIKDICVYKPGDLNKIGKEGRTSWDSFSYTIQMAHNVWTHIHAVQEANRQYDGGLYPEMLLASTMTGKRFRQNEHRYFRDVVNDIFAATTRSSAEKIIESYDRYWNRIIGSRGSRGDKVVNTKTAFNNLFEEV